LDLILWRHAEAEDGRPDLARKLTARGHKDAARIAQWLLKRLPSKFSVLASPAERTQQTASALGVAIKTVPALAPGASVTDILREAGWPHGKGTVVVVGHQPTLGLAAAALLSGREDYWSVKKGAVWWFTSRTRDEDGDDDRRTVLVAAIAPDQA
jgi:phosphohistidine phosphatase